jgi:metallo-beta-lactamase family protein
MFSLTFLGACGEVTGSHYLLKTPAGNILFELGLHQGSIQSELKNRHFDYAALQPLKAVVLTHAHLDHSGRLPLLAKHQYQNPIYCTKGTADLLEIMLKDSAHIQESDSMHINRIRRRQGKKLVEPLYTQDDVVKILKNIKTLDFKKTFNLLPDVECTFYPAGHILGSAHIELTIQGKKIILSGDIGHPAAPLLGDPYHFESADYVVMETTYGNRNHRPLDKTLLELEQILEKALAQQSKVIIPSFAVGRIQDLMYFLGALYQKRKWKLPVYIDSPMGLAASRVYASHQFALDAQVNAPFKNAEEIFRQPFLNFVEDIEDSRSLNDLKGAAVILSASGMCTGGRILHHLKHHLWQKDSAVVFVGYQAQGTLGRKLVDKQKKVYVLGERIHVAAQIHTIGGLSAHADQSGLLSWLSGMLKENVKVYLVHGEEKIRNIFKTKIEQVFNVQAHCPQNGERVDFDE